MPKFTKLEKYWRGIFSLTLTLVVWELVGRFNLVDEIFISMPSKVIIEGLKLIISGSLWAHLWISLEALVIGFFLSLLIGVAVALLIGYKERTYEFLSLHVHLLSALPVVAITPLVVIWFGIGITSKIAIVFLMSVVPILINVIDATRNVDKKMLNMAHSFGAHDKFIIKNIVFFSDLPSIFSSAKIAMGRGVIGIVIAEVFGYGKGLGYLVSYYASSFQTGKFMFVLLILLGINLIAVYVINVAEKKFVYWR